MKTACHAAAAVLLLLCCAACQHKPGPSAATSARGVPAYLNPQNIALRQQAWACTHWSEKLDYDKAFDLFYQAAQNGDVLAKLESSMVKWVYLEDDSYVKTGYLQLKVIPAVRKLADNGDAEAQYIYGWYYMSTDTKETEGLKYLKQAAGNGYPGACLTIGNALQEGRQIKKDVDGAAAWFLKGSQAGDGDASYTLAFLLADTKYPGHDFEKAVQYYEKAREQGCKYAYFALGLSYLKGLGARVDEKEAARYFQEGIARNDAQCYYGLGKMYVEGSGVARDYAKGRKLLEEAVARDAEGATEELAYLDELEKQGQ